MVGRLGVWMSVLTSRHVVGQPQLRGHGQQRAPPAVSHLPRKAHTFQGLSVAVVVENLVPRGSRTVLLMAGQRALAQERQPTCTKSSSAWNNEASLP